MTGKVRARVAAYERDMATVKTQVDSNDMHRFVKGQVDNVERDVRRLQAKVDNKHREMKEYVDREIGMVKELVDSKYQQASEEVAKS